MRTSCCALRGYEGHIRSLCYPCTSRIHKFPQPQTWKPIVRSIRSVVVVDFRDEAYASIACLLESHGLIIDQVKNASELAVTLVSKNPDLVLLSSTQPDENAWLTSAKLRTVDASRPVWIYASEPPSAIDEWLSMARTEDVIVYGGVLHRLLDLLRSRLSLKMLPSDRMAYEGQRRTVA